MQQNPIAIGCYCAAKNISETFKCVSCATHHHYSCYGYQIFDNIPDHLRCIKCRLENYEPFYNITEFFHPKQFFVLNKGEKYEKLKLKFEIKHHQFKNIKDQNQYVVAVICTKLKPTLTKKQQVQDKKQSFPSIYQWPSLNIYLELNEKHHIQYSDYEFAKIPVEYLKETNILVLTSDILEEKGIVAIALLQKVEIRNLLEGVIKNQDKINDWKQIEESYQLQIIQTDSLAANDQLILESPKLTINLIDPISYTLMDLPSRGQHCLHKDCYDVSRFLLINKKAEQGRWKCPICAKPTFKDDLIIDLVQQKILISIRKLYPTTYTNIEKIFIKNQNLDYELDLSKIKKEENILADEEGKSYEGCKQKLFHQINFKFNFKKIKEENPQFAAQIEKDSNEEFLLKSREECRDLLEQLRDNRIYSNFGKPFQYYCFFFHLFEIGDYLGHSIFVGNDLSQVKCLESICAEIWQFSSSGLIAEYLLTTNYTLHQICQVAIIFATDFTFQKFHYEKFIELTLAIAHGVTIYHKDFENYATRSPGYCIGYMLDYMNKNLSSNYSRKMNLMFFFQKHLSELYLPKKGTKNVLESKLYSTGELLIKLFEIRRKETLKYLVKDLFKTKGNLNQELIYSLTSLVYIILQIIHKKSDHQVMDETQLGKIDSDFQEVIGVLDQAATIKDLLKVQEINVKVFSEYFNHLSYPRILT